MPEMGSFFAVVLCTCQPRGLVNARHRCFLTQVVLGKVSWEDRVLLRSLGFIL